MKTKMGRPPLPKEKAKGIQVGVRFNPKDDKRVEKCVKEAGQTKAAWVRNAAIAESIKPPIWVKCNWTFEELNGQLVEFRLSAPKFWVEGVGEFLVRRNPRGELAIEICVQRLETPYKVVETRYFLCQPAAGKIEEHPNSKEIKFRLLG